MVRIWEDPVILNPALTPELVGVGQALNSLKNPVLFALTWCCYATTMRRSGTDRWLCSHCRDTIRTGGMNLQRRFEIQQAMLLEDYLRAQIWVSQWTGVPVDSVVVNVSWGWPV